MRGAAQGGDLFGVERVGDRLVGLAAARSSRIVSASGPVTAGRLIGRPWALRAASASRVRSPITERSHSATEAMTLATRRPLLVLVSIPRSSATRVASAASNHSSNRPKSTTEREARSSLATTRPPASPAAIRCSAWWRAGRSRLLPEWPSSRATSSSVQPRRWHSARIAFSWAARPLPASACSWVEQRGVAERDHRPDVTQAVGCVKACAALCQRRRAHLPALQLIREFLGALPHPRRKVWIVEQLSGQIPPSGERLP